MKGKFKILSGLVIFLCFLTSVSAIKVEVSVSPKIGGNIPYYNYTPEINKGELERIIITWSNTKTIGCKSKARGDIFKKSNGSYEYLRTVWSSIRIVEPGDHADFNLFFRPDEPGKYLVNTKIYHCNEVYDFRKINFSVKNSSNDYKKEIEIKSIENLPGGTLKFKLKSNKTKDVVIYPKEYPEGWIFPAKQEKIEANEEKTVTLNYSPSRWKEENVTFQAISLTGNSISGASSISVKKEETFLEKNALGLISGLSVILAFSLIMNLIHLTEFNPFKRE